MLGGGLIAQAISGSLLELTMPHPGQFLIFCSKILLYVGLVFGTQLALFAKMHKLHMPVSFQYISYCIGFTFAAMLGTGLLLR